MSEEESRWTSVRPSSPRTFGIYRERDPQCRPSLTPCCKTVFVLAVLSGATLLVIVVSLKLAEKGAVSEAQIIASQNSNITSFNVGETITSEVLSSTTEELDEEGMTRRARAFDDRARIINRPIITDQDMLGYSPLSAFSEAYPQLEGYRPPVRGLADLMSWVEPPRTAVKFSGLYFKAEEAARPYLNGHAYVSDPFVKFKPSHPAEINQLAIDQPNRFSNRPSGDSNSASSHTQAVFHPYTPLRPRPLKLMLDIYPVQPETQPTGGDEADPRIRRPRPTPTTTGRMIVHLNLYPKKNGKISRRRPIQFEKGPNERIYDEQLETTASEQPTTESTFEITTIATSSDPEQQLKNIY